MEGPVGLYTVGLSIKVFPCLLKKKINEVRKLKKIMQLVKEVISKVKK